MIENYVITTNQNVLTISRPKEGKILEFRLGEIISADVEDIIEAGMVALRITPPPSRAERTQQSRVITARTDLPLKQGDKVMLEVYGSDKELKLKFIGIKTPDKQETLPADKAALLKYQIQQLLSQLSASKLTTSEINSIKEAFASIPENIKLSYPLLEAFEQIMPGIERINNQLLKTQIESSGVLLETRLKLSALNYHGLFDNITPQNNTPPSDIASEDNANAAENNLPLTLRNEFAKVKELLEPLIKSGLSALEAINRLDAQNNSETIKDALNSIINLAQQTFSALKLLSPNFNLTYITSIVAAIINDAKNGLKTLDHLNSNNEPTLNITLERLIEGVSTLKSLELETMGELILEDRKALMYKLKELLHDDKLADLLRYMGVDYEKINSGVDKVIKNIEFFQLTSRANDMIYTFIPFVWEELKDGELIFKKNKYNAKRSFTCDISLDLKAMGKITASVTVNEGAFFVTIKTEKEDTKDLIAKNKFKLEKRFQEAGLNLKVINLSVREKINFQETLTEKGLNVLA
ncbi:hypothetical protein MCHI_000504 [Candidatus Magnetoovum chiemensis]|nr:hypothetical protein MCHI_000504 [Candidatus Magnetoovum chiemensis]